MKKIGKLFLALGMIAVFAGCKPTADEVELTKIEITTEPAKKEYFVGAAQLDLTGLKVTATYTDGTTADVTDKVTTSGFDSSAAVESQTIKISYTENDVTQTAEYTIVIKDKTIECQITYETQFGSVTSKKVEQGYKLTSEDLPSLTQTGYVFEGWDKSVGYEISADTKITASWKKIDSTFAISLDSGSELKFNVTINDKNLIFKVPTGYKTYEWYVDGKLDGDVTTNEYVLDTTLPYNSNARMEMPEYKYKNGKHEILVVVTAADGSKDSARATFVIEN